MAIAEPCINVIKITCKPICPQTHAFYADTHNNRCWDYPWGRTTPWVLIPGSVMRLTLSKSRSKLFLPCPLQGDLTVCFALGNVCFALGTKSYSSSQPQCIPIILSIVLGRAGFFTQALRSTCILLYMHWENTLSHMVLGSGLAKRSWGRAAVQGGYPGRDGALKQCKEFPVSSVTPVWGQQWGWPGTFVMSSM